MSPVQEEEDILESDEEVEEVKEVDVEALHDVLKYMASKGVTWGDLVEYISDPANNKGTTRYYGFFKDRTRVKQVLTFWTSWRNSPTARTTLHDWAVEYLCKKISSEAQASTKDGFLQSRLRSIDDTFLHGFSMPTMYGHLQRLCPTFLRLCRAFSSTTRQLREHSAKSKARKKTRIAAVMLDLLGERSQLNSWKKHLFGLFAYASGATRQMIAVLNTLGVCSSYPTLAGTQKRTGKHAFKLGSPSSEQNVLDPVMESTGIPSAPTLGELHSDEEADPDDAVEETPGGIPVNPPRTPVTARPTSKRRRGPVDPLVSTVGLSGFRNLGLLRTISLSRRVATKRLVREQLVEHVYDNINFMRRTEEQTLGNTDTMQNGTCATVTPLYEADVKHMSVTELLASHEAAPPLTMADIHLSSTERTLFHACMRHNILRIILAFGGPGFARFRDLVAETLPRTARCIGVHVTEVFPLPSMEIDESSITGNAEVLDTIFEELEYNTDDPTLPSTGTVKIISGDQLSISRLRSVMHNRAGHDDPKRSYLDLVFSPGLFHAQIHAVYGLLDTHWGNPNLGPYDPGSLAFHNSILERKPILLSSHPPYRICRDLTFVSLYARVLHCLELVAGKPLGEYVKTVSFTELEADAAAIYERYASSAVVDRMRQKRSKELRKWDGAAGEDTPVKGDMVVENAMLFLRDSLIVREFCDAIKSGDSGRVLLMLKTFALMYRGTGRSKYAYEMLHLIHNLTHVWPEELREIIMKNWLVNPTGHPNGFIPVDLLQEHMNLYIKTLYKAHGSNASWEWLEIISPCVVQLRKLASQMHETFGSAQGNKHAPPDLSYDISRLMDSLREFSVYTADPCGRAIEGPKASVADVLAVGAHQLIGPLAEYNELFERLRRRRRLHPVVGERPAIYSRASEDRVPACGGRTADIVPGVGPQIAQGSVRATAADSHSGDQEASQYSDDDELDRASVTSRRSSSQREILEPLGPSATSHASDAFSSSDGASEDEQVDVEDDERLPWEQILDEPLERVFTLDTEDDVDIYMY